ncbi:MAG TPA: biotin/lipoyl-containing protein, partial [Caulobacteraceae bacterium]|nr:biotin/lipoyl-containing protein [Caulobacteraceae bacterium]
AFAEAVAKAGLTWIGPPPEAIRAMGLKDAAKALMEKHGVPVTPGYHGADQSPKTLKAAAKKIGYPVLIKAVAGGGGRGMRRVDAEKDFDEALASAQREAKASFGDDRVLIEKFVENPRHIEVQVFGDAHGNVVHLFERDCSLQRRHQKVIEEAPAPGMDAATRAAVCEAAVKAARAVNYVGAGTVEFIADASEGLRVDRIWFMEMNTRLQVEHPVTEAVTGQDLVEWQLRVASGEPLPLAQGQIALSGHAMEARLYAENPATGFLPSTGELEHLRLPGDIRIDSAVEEGDEVSPHYDPMIAKLIVHADSREAAAAQLAEACARVEVWPVKTNAAFLGRCAAHADFVSGAIDTGFIEARLEALATPPEPSRQAIEAAGAALNLAGADEVSPWSGGGDLAGFRLNAPSAGARVVCNGKLYEAALDSDLEADVLIADDEVVVFAAGEAFVFTAPLARGGDEAGAVGDGSVRSPMPGKIVSISVEKGQAVARGAPLVTLEAMKMEHTLTAAFDGEVTDVMVKSGDQVSEGMLLVALERQGTDG